MRIVFGSHTHLGGSFVVGSHHLARELHRLGHTVAHVGTPVTPFHLVRRRDADVRLRLDLARRPRDAGGVLNVVPVSVLPWAAVGRVPVLRSRGLFMPPGRLRRQVCQHLGGPVDLLLLDQPKLLGLVALLRPEVLVYRPTDLYAHMSNSTAIAGAEADAVHLADAVVATSQPVAQHVARLAPRCAPVVLPNGVDVRLFSTPRSRPPEIGSGRPHAVWVGALDGRFDVATLTALADAHRHVVFLLIGPRTRRPIPQRENVRVLGPRPYVQVPGYLQHADVGLLLLNDDPANAGRSPMKLYEYAAAGLRVLARATPELVRRAEPFVATYAGPGDAPGVLAGLLPGASTTVVQPRLEQIVDHDWARVAERLLAVAERVRGPAR